MGTNIPIERLYLWKETGKDVFIDNCSVYDHQVDGLRFLWKQFKKKNPGVVLNYPVHGGTSVTIALFLYAVRQFLLQPVLILCKDDADVAKWHHCLCQWTGFTAEDIVVKPTKALLKKQIFIKSMSELGGPFTRRSWSMLVYKNDEYIGLPQFSSVDFYIWATSTDVLKDLNFLSTIYNWMSPKANMNFDDGGGDLKKVIFLDTLLEDIVLRRTRITSHEDEIVDLYKTVKRSKNKDITGTKIKRSKVQSSSCQADIVSEQANAIDIVENISRDKHTVSRNESHDYDNLHQSMQIENTSRFNKCKELNVKKPQDIEENTQTDNCILHYDETPSDIGSPFCEPNVSETNSNDAISIPESSVTNENTKTLGTHISDNFKIEPTEDRDIAAKIGPKDDIKDILKSKNIETDINKKIKLSVDVGDNDLDSKLNEMEEKAMKKFKGSLLDSIF